MKKKLGIPIKDGTENIGTDIGAFHYRVRDTIPHLVTTLQKKTRQE